MPAAAQDVAALRTDNTPVAARYDIIVVGGGSAGYAAARTAAAQKLKVAVVEGGPEVGGLCILRGCMPTKALLESAHRFRAMGEGREFGLHAPAPRADWGQIVQRKNRLVGEFASHRREQLSAGKFDMYRARASFQDPWTLKLERLDSRDTKTPKELEGRGFILATGSEVAQLDIPGLEAAGYLTSDEALQVTRPLQSLVVLGGGPIAIEMADYFCCLGTRVTLIQRSGQVLRSHDPDVAAELEAALRAKGLRIFTGTKLIEVRRKGMHKEVEFEQNGRRQVVTAAQILQALGRRPMTRGLNLKAAGVKEHADGRVKVDGSMRTYRKHIYAAGDVSGPYEVVHTAIAQAEVAARNLGRWLRGKKKREKMDYRLQMEVVFSEPEVAGVGINEKEAAAARRKVLAAKYPFNDHGKSILMGAKHGFVKVVADRKTGEIVGAQIVGPHASDLIHEFSVAMHFRSTVHEFLKIPHYHPTLAEIVSYPVEELAEKIKES